MENHHFSWVKPLFRLGHFNNSYGGTNPNSFQACADESPHPGLLILGESESGVDIENLKYHK
jgi:Fe-S cluster assembly ATPase SufC